MAKVDWSRPLESSTGERATLASLPDDASEPVKVFIRDQFAYFNLDGSPATVKTWLRFGGLRNSVFSPGKYGA